VVFIVSKFDKKLTMSTKNQLLAQYDLHDVLFNNVIDNISEVESNQAIVEPLNSIKWLAGHLLWAQRNLVRISGAQVDIPWTGHFLTIQGSTEEERKMPKGEFPTLDQIRNKWNEVTPAIRAGLANLPEAALNSIVEAKHPIAPFDNTLAGLWAFINDHQSYHIGQIGILRRALGKEAMAYFKN
jgi:uncharacterized damage-inducible protein DinB